MCVCVCIYADLRTLRFEGSPTHNGFSTHCLLTFGAPRARCTLLVLGHANQLFGEGVQRAHGVVCGREKAQVVLQALKLQSQYGGQHAVRKDKTEQGEK